MNLIREYKKMNNIIKNIFGVMSLESISSLVGLSVTFILIYFLGTEKNGMVIIIQSYCLLVNDIFNFQSFNALIKYISLNKIDINYTKNIVKQSYICDIITAIIATMVGFGVLPIAMSFMEWENYIGNLIKIYMISIMFNINGTAIGVIRYYNKFIYSTIINFSYMLARLIIYVIMNKRLSLELVIYVESFLFIMKNILLNIIAIKILSNNGIHNLMRFKSKFNKDFFMFNFYSNISVTLDLPFQYLATFFINKFLGFNENTVYRVFQNIGAILTKFTNPINQVIYPEMAKEISKSNSSRAVRYFIKIFKTIFILSFLISVVLFLFKNIWFKGLVGNISIYNIALIIYLVYCIISASTMAIHPLFMALGYIKYNLPILIIANSLYCIVLYYLGKKIGLVGINISLLMQSSIIIIFKMVIIYINYNKK